MNVHLICGTRCENCIIFLSLKKKIVKQGKENQHIVLDKNDV